jgi:UDPglucose 6-dehydrogenase
MPLRITVLGTGYLGATHAACLAELGFEVLGLDTNEAQVGALAAGRLPFHEPELQQLLESGLRSGRLRFSTSYADAAAFGDVHFVCVGTPQRPDSDAADLSHLMACVDALAPLLDRPCLVVGKSTVPVGTSETVADRLARVAPAGAAAEVAWNPEFLREGHAVADTLRPDRIVVGVRSARAEAVLREVYAGPVAAGVPFLVTDLTTAELVKTSANAFLATKVSFINAIAEVCEAVGADVVPLAEALALDERIGGRFLVPGLGFGGGCLPKDIRAFAAATRDLGVGSVSALLSEVDAINLRRRARMVDLALEMAGGSLEGRAVGVLGCSFKPGSDDIRDSPALDVAGTVHGLGARVTVYDPAAMDRARQVHPELEYADSMLAAAADAEVLLLLTEWREFVEADPEVVGKVVARRNIADGRSVLDADRWRSAGWRCRALGRPDAQSSADSISLSAESTGR